MAKKHKKHKKQNRIAELYSEDAAKRYYACRAMQTEDLDVQNVLERLIELLSDPIDWDCQNYVAVAAADALARLEPTGKQWLLPAYEACRQHLEASGDVLLARGVLAAVRRVTDAMTFIEWGRMVFEEDIEGGEVWSGSFLDVYGSEWYTDRALATTIVNHPDRNVTLGVAIKLLKSQDVLNHMIRHCPDERAQNEQHLDFNKSLLGSIPVEVIAEAQEWWRRFDAERYGIAKAADGS